MMFLFAVWLGLVLALAQVSMVTPLYWFLLVGGVIFFKWLDRR